MISQELKLIEEDIKNHKATLKRLEALRDSFKIAEIIKEIPINSAWLDDDEDNDTIYYVIHSVKPDTDEFRDRKTFSVGYSSCTCCFNDDTIYLDINCTYTGTFENIKRHFGKQINMLPVLVTEAFEFWKNNSK